MCTVRLAHAKGVFNEKATLLRWSPRCGGGQEIELVMIM
jgi:hypothetical protein